MILGELCLVFQALPSLYGGRYMYMQEAHVHAGTEEVLCPLDQDQLIVFIVVLMNKEKDHSLGWVVLGVWCSVV